VTTICSAENMNFDLSASAPLRLPSHGLQIVHRPDPLYHLVLLLLCSATILLALPLSIRSQSQVVEPLVGIPLPELCMMRRTLGIGCPGCGLTRCFIALAHGDVASAWSYNPAGIWLFAIMAFQIPFRSLQLVRIRRRLPEIAMHRTAPIALSIFAIVLLAQWIIRLAGVAF
jgi:uncharacterized protein DUF2752